MENLPQSPDLLIAPANSKHAKGHVFAIWAISVLYLLFAAYALFTMGAVLSGTIDVSGSDYFQNLHPVDYAVLFGIPFSEAIAATLFLFRRKVAEYFWLAALVVNVLGYILAIIHRDWAQDITAVKVLGFTSRILALICIARYSAYLARLQILK